MLIFLTYAPTALGMFKMILHVINAMHGFITNVLVSQKKRVVQGWQKTDYICNFCQDDLLHVYMDRSSVEFQETSEQHTNELEPYESTVEETSLKTVKHNTNDQLTLNSNSTDHSTPITIMHETEIKSTGSQSATIAHKQVDAGKSNKKSSKCVITKSDKEDVIVNQKTRILNLENEIKQLKKVVDTYTRTGPYAATMTENTDGVQPATYHHPNHQPNPPATMQDLLEHRMRILETQMMQTMCINTVIHTKIDLQSRSPPSPYIGQGGPHGYPYLLPHPAYTAPYVPMFQPPMNRPPAYYSPNIPPPTQQTNFGYVQKKCTSSTNVCQIRIFTAITSTYQTISSPRRKATLCSAP